MRFMNMAVPNPERIRALLAETADVTVDGVVCSTASPKGAQPIAADDVRGGQLSKRGVTASASARWLVHRLLRETVDMSKPGVRAAMRDIGGEAVSGITMDRFMQNPGICTPLDAQQVTHFACYFAQGDGALEEALQGALSVIPQRDAVRHIAQYFDPRRAAISQDTTPGRPTTRRVMRQSVMQVRGTYGNVLMQVLEAARIGQADLIDYMQENGFQKGEERQSLVYKIHMLTTPDSDPMPELRRDVVAALRLHQADGDEHQLWRLRYLEALTETAGVNLSRNARGRE